MNNIPTAEQWIKQEYGVEHIDHITVKGTTLAKDMIEFAKLHVEAALKAASENATLDSINLGASEFQTVVDKNSILDAYPLENIK